MQNVTRPDWDSYFLGIANAVSQRGDCTRSQVGAVLVGPDRRIISTGYNGTMPNVSGCLDGGCPRGRFSYESLPSNDDYSNCIAVHAERNAVIYSDTSKRFGSTLYVTRRPCVGCKELLLAEGISRVVWLSSDNVLCTELLFE